ncbi:MAG: c-type cytochrome [Pseudomonadota bacterium]|nr:c-type cytochrome [Pseudomonadota bacterium]
MRIVLLFALLSIALAGCQEPSSDAAAQANGAQLYAQHCAACHGDNGGGGVGVPLNLPAFQYGVSDDFLKVTIQRGRPGRVMPAFSELSEAEVDALVEHLRSWAPGRPVIPANGHIDGNPQRGKALYAKHCASCHGSNGEGGEGTGVTFSRPRDLPIIAPALNNDGFLAAASDQLIKAAVVNGREGTPMTSFREQGLSDTQINDIVSYVRSFENQPDPNPVGNPDDEPLTIAHDSPYSVEETVKALERAAVGRNFRIIRTQTLEDGLFPEQEQNPNQVIVYFCNFDLVNRALAIDPRVGLFLPCRVTVVEQDDGVKVMSINPKRLAYLFNNAELNRLCDEMVKTYSNIIEEATF